MPNQKAQHGFERLRRASGFSWQGLRAAWMHEAAFREEVIALLILTPCAWWLGDNALERALLVASMLGVLVVELLNSALEAIVDRIGLEHHELSGRAKDIGSAAVLLSIVACALVWLSVLFS